MSQGLQDAEAENPHFLPLYAADHYRRAPGTWFQVGRLTPSLRGPKTYPQSSEAQTGRLASWRNGSWVMPLKEKAAVEAIARTASSSDYHRKPPPHGFALSTISLEPYAGFLPRVPDPVWVPLPAHLDKQSQDMFSSMGRESVGPPVSATPDMMMMMTTKKPAERAMEGGNRRNEEDAVQQLPSILKSDRGKSLRPRTERVVRIEGVEPGAAPSQTELARGELQATKESILAARKERARKWGWEKDDRVPARRRMVEFAWQINYAQNINKRREIENKNERIDQDLVNKSKHYLKVKL
jgi:hypothetical protein